jgi:putative two-component system response regulator
MDEHILQSARILIVDDQAANTRLLQEMLGRAGYAHIVSTTQSQETLPLCEAFNPDLLLLDLHMPPPDGYTILRRLSAGIPREQAFPILVISADVASEARRMVLAHGGKDFLSKPFDMVEVLLRIRNLLETHFLSRQLRAQNQQLEQRVRERTQALEDARLEMLTRLGRAAEYRDDDTGQHTERVACMARRLAQALGLPPEETERIYHAAQLHDVGKIGISDTILLRPGKLSPEEFKAIQAHTTIGASILDGSQSELLQLASVIALTHHERWNGTGYPHGLAGEEIPLPGRIVAVADVFDALTHVRPYKPAWPADQAIAEIVRQRGQHFDPAVVDAFVTILKCDGQRRSREATAPA